jgi:hypothetical protein
MQCMRSAKITAAAARRRSANTACMSPPAGWRRGGLVGRVRRELKTRWRSTRQLGLVTNTPTRPAPQTSKNFRVRQSAPHLRRSRGCRPVVVIADAPTKIKVLMTEIPPLGQCRRASGPAARPETDSFSRGPGGFGPPVPGKCCRLAHHVRYRAGLGHQHAGRGGTASEGRRGDKRPGTIGEPVRRSTRGGARWWVSSTSRPG